VIVKKKENIFMSYYFAPSTSPAPLADLEPIAFTNYASLCQEELMYTPEGMPYGSHWSWRFAQGPWTWMLDEDGTLPNWNMSAFAREEDLWAEGGGSCLVCVGNSMNKC
jgi:hypothetical protein